jgi:hypothetical protein
VLVIGVGARLALGGTGVGDLSALVVGALIAVGMWLGVRLVAGPRVALVATILVVALVDVAALPSRDQPAYDDLQAFYSTDQELSVSLPVQPGGASAISLLVRPVFSGPRARFGLAGDVNGAAYQWACQFAQGVQTLALPAAMEGPRADVKLRLTGSPSRDGDYLVVYASSRLGGFIVSAAPPGPTATSCSLI